MLIGKTTVYLMTHSVAIFSDAAESVVHVIAVGFAWFSLRLSTRSASPQFLYGYERITFFSAGFEGAMIVVAAVAILYESIRKWMAGLQLEHLGTGTALILLAGIFNAGLGYYLLRVGRRTNSLILEADGKHVLTDSWTSFGVVGAKPSDSRNCVCILMVRQPRSPSITVSRHKRASEQSNTIAELAHRRVMAVLACLKVLCPDADLRTQQQLASKILSLAHGKDRPIPQKRITPAAVYEMFTRNS